MNANTSQQPRHRWKVIFQYYQLKTIFMKITWEYKKKRFAFRFFFSPNTNLNNFLSTWYITFTALDYTPLIFEQKKNFSSLLFLKTCSELKTHNKVVQRPGPRHLQHKVAHARLCRKFSYIFFCFFLLAAIVPRRLPPRKQHNTLHLK